MKSVKKRFRVVLRQVSRAVEDLSLLTRDLPMLEPLQALIDDAKQACDVLSDKAKRIEKADFVVRMREESALSELDALVDMDVISEVERSLSAVLSAEEAEGRLAEFLQGFLQKLEQQQLTMNGHIQQLGELLNDAD